MLVLVAARGLHRLLARRRPALGDGPRDRLLGRRSRSRSSARTSWSWLFGRAVPGRSTAFWPRMYIAHVLLFPILIGTLLDRAPAARRAAPPHAVPRTRARRPSDASSACRRSRARRRARSGCSLAVAGVLFLLGGLVQINPIWLWGPYHTYARDERRAARLVPRLADRRACGSCRASTS